MREHILDLHSYHIDGELPHSEELATRIQGGDEAAAHMLLSRNEGFLNSCAMDLCDRYGIHHQAQDLKQEGALALLQAARQFNGQKSVRFLTYAWPIVRAAMLDHAAEATLPLRLPPSRYHQLRRVSWLLASAPPGMDDTALLEWISEEMDISRRVALDLITEVRNLFASVQLGDRVFDLSCGGDPAVGYAARLRQAHIGQLLTLLTPRERIVVERYCGFGMPEGSMTFEEIAVQLNFNSPSAAKKAFRRAVSKLAQMYGKTGDYGAWHMAEKAVRKARRENSEPLEYTAPQQPWHEKERALKEDFLQLVGALSKTFSIMHEAVESDNVLLNSDGM